MVETVERIPQHRHCVNCGKSFVEEKRFCSQACKDTTEDEVKKKLIRAAIVAVTIVFVVLNLGADE